MAGEGAAIGVHAEVIRVDRGQPRLFGVGRRQPHRSRNVQHQVEIEIRRQRGTRFGSAGESSRRFEIGPWRTNCFMSVFDGRGAGTTPAAATDRTGSLMEKTSHRAASRAFVRATRTSFPRPRPAARPPSRAAPARQGPRSPGLRAHGCAGFDRRHARRAQAAAHLVRPRSRSRRERAIRGARPQLPGCKVLVDAEVMRPIAILDSIRPSPPARTLAAWLQSLLRSSPVLRPPRC